VILRQKFEDTEGKSPETLTVLPSSAHFPSSICYRAGSYYS